MGGAEQQDQERGNEDMDGVTWRESSRCDSNLCVSIWPGSRSTWLRNSGNPSAVLDVPNEDYAVFIGAVRRGELMRP